MKHFHEDITGYFNYADLYEHVVSEFDTGSLFVELGAWKGKSAAFMAVEIRNSKKGIRFDVVDNFQGLYQEFKQRDSLKYFRKEYEECVRNLNSVPEVRIIAMRSGEAVGLYKKKSIDFLFIDGNHSYGHVTHDIKVWLPRMKPGGIIAGHDYGNDDYPGVKQAVDELLPDAEQFGDVCWYYRIPKRVRRKKKDD